ncbi:MAG: alpha/beta fold hydrolase [Myxococcales bacterium]|nr:alpha/beta fold hydrolase [Myxococcales bacterium]
MLELITVAGAVAAVGTVGFVVASHTVPDRLLELGKELSRRAAGMARKHVDAAGHRIAYFERGAGEPVVLLHGFSSNKDGWMSYARFMKGYRLIIPDLPGWADSSYDEAERYGYPDQVARLKAFLDALAVGPVHLAGNSMGGGIAGIFAATHPADVKSVLLMDNGAVEMPNPSGFQQAIEETGQNALIVRSVADVDVLLDHCFHRKMRLPAVAKRIYASEGMARVDKNERIFQQLWEDWDSLEPLLSRIEAPTLVMWGRHDRIIDVSVVEAMEPKLTNARTVIYDEAGHLPYMEIPARAAADHKQLIDSAT